LSRCSARTSA